MTEDDYPPFDFIGPDGALTGFNVDLARADGWTSITKRKAALADADEWKDKTGKISELIK